MVLWQQSQHSMITLIKFTLHARLAIFMVSHYNGCEFIAYALLGERVGAPAVRFMQLAAVYLRVCIMQPNFMGLGGHTALVVYKSHS